MALPSGHWALVLLLLRYQLEETEIDDLSYTHFLDRLGIKTISNQFDPRK